MVVLACDNISYVLRFDRDAYTAAVQAGNLKEDGVENAFEVVTDINET